MLTELYKMLLGIEFSFEPLDSTAFTAECKKGGGQIHN